MKRVHSSERSRRNTIGSFEFFHHSFIIVFCVGANRRILFSRKLNKLFSVRDSRGVFTL